MAKDWTAQAEEMVQHWTSAQRKMWESWFEAMQNVSYAPRSSEGWQHTVQNWNRAVKSALESQFAWTRFWANSLQTRNTPAPVVEWSQELVKMLERWTETQLELSESWFETIKKSSPTTVALAWDRAEAERVVQDWQEATRKSLEAQLNWLRIWTSVHAQWYLQQAEQSTPGAITDVATPTAPVAEANTSPDNQSSANAGPPVDAIQPAAPNFVPDAPPDSNDSLASTTSAADTPAPPRPKPKSKPKPKSTATTKKPTPAASATDPGEKPAPARTTRKTTKPKETE